MTSHAGVLGGHAIVGGPQTARLFPKFTDEESDLTDSTEAEIGFVGPLSTFLDSDNVVIDADVQWVVGAGEEFLTLKIRRGAGITGPQVGTIQYGGAAAIDNFLLPVHVQGQDQPGDVDNIVYTITAEVVGP
jgi:hypothetical protein